MPMLAVATRFRTEMDHLKSVAELTRVTFDLARTTPKRLRSRHTVVTAALTVRGAARRVASDAIPFEGAFLVACAQYELAMRDLIEAFANVAATKVANYSSLPQPLRDSHVRGAARILQRINWDQFRHLNSDDIVKVLAGCVAQARGSSYTLLPEAFSANERNFKSEVVGSHIGNLGLRKFWDQMGSQAVLQAALQTSSRSLTTRYAIQKLDHLMDRRNQLIHRGKGVALVGESEVLEAADFFAALVTSSADVLTLYVSTL